MHLCSQHIRSRTCQCDQSWTASRYPRRSLACIRNCQGCQDQRVSFQQESNHQMRSQSCHSPSTASAWDLISNLLLYWTHAYRATILRRPSSSCPFHAHAHPPPSSQPLNRWPYHSALSVLSNEYHLWSKVCALCSLTESEAGMCSRSTRGYFRSCLICRSLSCRWSSWICSSWSRRSFRGRGILGRHSPILLRESAGLACALWRRISRSWPLLSGLRRHPHHAGSWELCMLLFSPYDPFLEVAGITNCLALGELSLSECIRSLDRLWSKVWGTQCSWPRTSFWSSSLDTPPTHSRSCQTATHCCHFRAALASRPQLLICCPSYCQAHCQSTPCRPCWPSSHHLVSDHWSKYHTSAYAHLLTFWACCLSPFLPYTSNECCTAPWSLVTSTWSLEFQLWWQRHQSGR